MIKAAGGGRYDTATPAGKAMRESSVKSFLWLSGGGGVSATLTIVALPGGFGRIGIAPSIIQAPDLALAMVKTGMATTLVAGVTMSGLPAAAMLFVLSLICAPAFVPLSRVVPELFGEEGELLTPYIKKTHSRLWRRGGPGNCNE